MTCPKSHGGHATAAKRRGEVVVLCLTCGQRPKAAKP